VLLSNAAVAIEDTTTSQIVSSSNNTSYVSTLANMLGGLIVVIALIFLLAYIVKRLNLVPSQNALIKTIAMTQVGQKEKLMVI